MLINDSSASDMIAELPVTQNAVTLINTNVTLVPTAKIAHRSAARPSNSLRSTIAGLRVTNRLNRGL